MEGSGSSGEDNKYLLDHELQQHLLLSPRKVAAVASINVGVQFGWALQFSLLTPYVELLGIPHKWASFIWLCGPISGLVVQPLAGYYSDGCTSRFGRRRPFIAGAAALVALGVVLIGFAADIGHASGDPLGVTAKPRAIAVFVVGFWIFDVGNNLLMSPCRALLADLSAYNQRKTRNANALFSFFAAIGNVLGYAAGSYSDLHNLFPFTSTTACDVYCANLKSCFLISIALLLGLTILALKTVREIPLCEPEAGMECGEMKKSKTVPFVGDLLSALRDYPRSMWILLLVTCLCSIAWFGFSLYDTDWMGREVYGGSVGGELYDDGVREGSLGLMLKAAVAGATALAVMLLAREVRDCNWMWGASNILLALCLGSTVWITGAAESTRRHALQSGGGGPDPGVKAAALTLFAVLGIPQALFDTIPFALATIYSTTADFGDFGHGLCMGVLNLAIVIPQLVVSLSSGPWDELFGGGNLPSFVAGAIAAALSGVFAFTFLPSPRPVHSSRSLNIAVAAATSSSH